MSNIGKVESFINDLSTVVDRWGTPQYVGSMYAALAWSMASKIIRTNEYMHRLNLTLETIALANEGDDETIREKSENTLKEMAKAERRLEEFKNMFSYASANSYKGGANPEAMVELMAEPNEVRVEDVIDLDDLKASVAAGDMTQQQADEEIAEAMAEQEEANKKLAVWYDTVRSSLIKELETAQKVHPGDFEISDELYVQIIEKMSDKMDNFIEKNGKQSRRKTIARAHRINAKQNKALLASLQEQVDDMVRATRQTLNGAGYPVDDEIGVH